MVLHTCVAVDLHEYPVGEIIVNAVGANLCRLFSVHEKEKLRGRDPDKEDEEAGFGEYTRT